MNAEYMSQSLDDRAADSHLPYREEANQALHLIVISSSIGSIGERVTYEKGMGRPKGQQVNNPQHIVTTNSLFQANSNAIASI
jgi:hypothetical protein